MRRLAHVLPCSAGDDSCRGEIKVPQPDAAGDDDWQKQLFSETLALETLIAALEAPSSFNCTQSVAVAPLLIMQSLSKLDLTAHEVLRCEPYIIGSDFHDAVCHFVSSRLTLCRRWRRTRWFAGSAWMWQGQATRWCSRAPAPGTCTPAASPGGSYSRQVLGARSPFFPVDIASQRLAPRNRSSLLLMTREDCREWPLRSEAPATADGLYFDLCKRHWYQLICHSTVVLPFSWQCAHSIMDN